MKSLIQTVGEMMLNEASHHPKMGDVFSAPFFAPAFSLLAFASHGLLSLGRGCPVWCSSNPRQSAFSSPLRFTRSHTVRLNLHQQRRNRIATEINNTVTPQRKTSHTHCLLKRNLQGQVISFFFLVGYFNKRITIISNLWDPEFIWAADKIQT